jgi:sRNA-binding carbon storage regulator CsrA
MLVLERRHGESVIFVGDDGRPTRATVKLVGGRVRLHIEGPARVLRTEVYELANRDAGLLVEIVKFEKT